ncbi:MAG: hypothetical protein JXR70_09675 [Spirochaetales bacterium]|nr:hypothetical protein [Spirochaetales bacterium]
MKRIENRILTGIRKTSNTKEYHRFIIDNSDDNLVLKFDEDHNDVSFPEEQMDNIVLPMQYIPDFIGLITKAFFCNDYNEGYYEKFIDDIRLFSSVYIDERGFIITELRFGVEYAESDEGDFASLQWPNLMFPLKDLSKRIMPPSLAWLLDTLKNYYNEWQKNHPEHPPMSD